MTREPRFNKFCRWSNTSSGRPTPTGISRRVVDLASWNGIGPSSALMETGEFIPEGIVVAPSAIGFVPRPGLEEKEIRSTGLSYARKYPEFGPSYTHEAPFSEVVLAGPYVFTTIWASDYETGVNPDVILPDWVWWGTEIRNEALWGMDALRRKLETGGTSLENAVHCTVLLNEIEDLYELDLVWKEAFGDNPPARTVTPVRGLGVATMGRRQAP